MAEKKITPKAADTEPPKASTAAAGVQKKSSEEEWRKKKIGQEDAPSAPELLAHERPPMRPGSPGPSACPRSR